MSDHVGFSRKIVCSDRFLSLPNSARLLYYVLGTEARKKGVVIGARHIATSNGILPISLDVLVDNKFLLKNEDGTYTIIDWYENNGVGETANNRNNYSYRKFRESIIERDGFKCKKCGRTDHLEVHHIKQFATCPDLRLEPTNAITLCHDCHAKLHGLEKHE